MYTNEFIITNIEIVADLLPKVVVHKDFSISTTNQDVYYGENSSQSCIIIGPLQLNRENQIADISIEEVIELFLLNPDEFITKIKGDFTILLFNDNSFKVYSDRFAIRKFFYWSNSESFIISNNISFITKNVDVTSSKEHMALYALTYHFIGGITIYKDVFHNSPAQTLEYSKSKLKKSTYWDICELLDDQDETIRLEDIAEELTNSIQQGIVSRKKDTISLSLTAGNDSRLLLSILLNIKDLKFRTYTYGNPDSIDCIIAKQIAQKNRIEHSTYDIKFDDYSFLEASIESIAVGNTLSSLHRAHRLVALKKESEFSNCLILGTMGGEFIKGANHDDYIISDFIYAFCKHPNQKTISNYLMPKGVNPDKVDLEYIYNLLMGQNWIKYPDLSEFYLLFEIASGLHHLQNTIQLEHKFQNILTPFIDYDYLKLLFSSKFNFLQKRTYKSNFRQRLENHKFASRMQSFLLPELSKIPYNSGFKAEEYNYNKWYALMRSRVRKYRWNHPPNFILNDWMLDFANNELSKLNHETSLVSELFDIERLLFDLKYNELIPKESYWLKYTTPIQMAYTLKIFSS